MKTPREVEVMLLVEQKLSNAAIAARLNIAINTVKVHKRNVYSLLDTKRHITQREHDVWKLIAVRGLNAKEVASELGIGYKSVQTHKQNLYRKLMVHNLVQLTIFYHNRKAKAVGA